MTRRTKNQSSHNMQKPSAKPKGSGPIALFIALFIIALGAIQLVSTFHTYALDLSELNGLKKQEAALIAKKQQLENDIERWDDKAYVTAQARERLGYVFAGEQPIRVEHPEAVTGQPAPTDTNNDDAGATTNKPLPWYSELAYALKESDADRKQAKDTSSTSDTPASAPQQDASDTPQP
ncbi:FtsB family cell division protein [Bifidobacterium gallicum]|uniref:Septum formation initiator n=1 Tax=Bifidobacterium gallicum DSM 20093 = LMG 11596 TaxID=561180 RepID=D1NS51_9BIFI|nr:septum formation initiator [Bifidobacterium gallicum DSM 20093 = LMG 11596]KFI57216.1 septum formation initiator family protein [Bifidobacterium gallicum DSM 20093 = LMG 11596]